MVATGVATGITGRFQGSVGPGRGTVWGFVLALVSAYHVKYWRRDRENLGIFQVPVGPRRCTVWGWLACPVDCGQLSRGERQACLAVWFHWCWDVQLLDTGEATKKQLSALIWRSFQGPVGPRGGLVWDRLVYPVECRQVSGHFQCSGSILVQMFSYKKQEKWQGETIDLASQSCPPLHGSAHQDSQLPSFSLALWNNLCHKPHVAMVTWYH